VRIQPIFRWFDLWIGLYIDREKRTVYLFPVPMFGFKITSCAKGAENTRAGEDGE